MESRSFPKIPDWPQAAEPGKGRNKGAASLVTMLLFIMFSALGMGILYVTQIYLLSSAFRKHSAALDYASENGVKRGLRDLLDLLAANGTLTSLTQAEWEDVPSDVSAGGASSLQMAFGSSFPLLAEEAWEGQLWTSRTAVALKSFREPEGWLFIQYGFEVESEGKLDSFEPTRTSSLSGEVEIAAGHIPLVLFPFLLDKALTPEEKRQLPADLSISLAPTPSNLASPGLLTTGGTVVPKDASPLLAKALRTHIFRPQDLSAARLRQALGLEPSDEPVPEGVYLIRDDFGLGGIYVQGDLQEMVLAVSGDEQVISFRMEADRWVLRFSPSACRTVFFTPEGETSYDLIPAAIVVVSGKIESLGGGTCQPSGEIAMSADPEVPAVLEGVGLTILASSRVVISSHLVLQGVRTQDGIPYVKDGKTQLVIFSTGSDFAGEFETEGGITVGGQAPDEVRIQGSLTAGGGGFAIEGEGKKAVLLGGLQTKNYSSGGNSLRIVPDERFLRGLSVPEGSPASATPLLAVLSIELTEWKEY